MNDLIAATQEILTISEAARELRVAVDTCRAWADSGRLPVIRVARGQRLFRREDIVYAVAAKNAALESRSAK